MSRVRSGVFAAWASAWLAGKVSFDDAIGHAIGSDEAHCVVGLVEAAQTPLGWLLTALRERGADAARVVLPVPGDPRGLPAATPFSAAALAAGEAVTAANLGLVPRVTGPGAAQTGQARRVRWTAYQIGASPPDPITVATAEHELAAAVRETASTLAALEVPSWRPELSAEVGRVRREAAVPDLPPSHDTRAVRLLVQADRLAAVLELAAADAPGGALTGEQAQQRQAALHLLQTAVRRARMAAYNGQLRRQR